MNAGGFLHVSVLNSLDGSSENEMNSQRLSHHRDDPNQDINQAKTHFLLAPQQPSGSDS